MRLDNLDLNLLVVLDIMLAEQSVSQTAQRLNMTQPAISNALARLRSHFNDELFVVMGRRMAPTPLCERLAGPVQSVIAELRQIAGTRATFDPATADRTVTTVCSDYIFMVFLSEVYRQLAALAPRLRLRTLLTSESMGDLLRSGRADFALIPRPRAVEGLPQAPVFTDGFSVISWTGNTLIGDTLTRDLYLSLRHVGTSIGPETPPHIEQESLEAQGVVRDIAVFAPNFTSVAEVVAGTPYIATVHTRAAMMLAARLPLRIHPPPIPIAPFEVVVQWNVSQSGDPGATWFRGLLETCGAAMPAHHAP